VAEALNGRLSEFTFDGSFVRTYHAGYAAGHIAATAADRLAVSRSSTHYALLLDRGNGARALRRRLSVDASAKYEALAGHDLLTSDSAHAWVFDQRDAEICGYQSPQATPECRRLPAALVRRLARWRDARVA